MVSTAQNFMSHYTLHVINRTVRPQQLAPWPLWCIQHHRYVSILIWILTMRVMVRLCLTYNYNIDWRLNIDITGGRRGEIEGLIWSWKPFWIRSLSPYLTCPSSTLRHTQKKCVQNHGWRMLVVTGADDEQGGTGCSSQIDDVGSWILACYT